MGSGSAPASGSIADLIVGGPYPCISPPETPPLPVVNEMRQNPGGAGMNGGRRWDGFTITRPEYEQLVVELVELSGFERSLVPEWAQTRDDRHAWIMERRWGDGGQKSGVVAVIISCHEGGDAH